MRCRSESKSSVASLELSENDNESDTNNVIDLREHKENNEGNENENTGVGGVKLNPKQENVFGMYRRVYSSSYIQFPAGKLYQRTMS